MKRAMADVVLLGSDLSEKDALNVEMMHLKEYLEERKLSVCVRNVREVRGCTGCGKCIRRNRCVIEDDVNGAADDIRDARAVIVCTKVLYGEISEPTEKLMIRLMHSASNFFSHAILVSLYDCRGEDRDPAEEKMESFCRQAGAIDLTSWAKAEIHHPDDLNYAYEELVWLLQCMKKGNTPSSEFPRKLDFTR